MFADRYDGFIPSHATVNEGSLFPGVSCSTSQLREADTANLVRQGHKRNVSIYGQSLSISRPVSGGSLFESTLYGV